MKTRKAGTVSHRRQQHLWEEEHKHPHILLPMDSTDVSSGVELFVQWLKKKGIDLARLHGIEMACGKGRNVIGLARQGMYMTGLDFSTSAIREARRRAKRSVVPQTRFLVHDVTKRWPFPRNTFDLAIDCFGSTDIESPQGRTAARQEILRILKPGGYFLLYTLSTDDEFHKAMMKVSPGREQNSFVHPTNGKFEKTFDRAELMALYKDFRLITLRRVRKTAEFFGKTYKNKHFWVIWQKPARKTS